MVSVAQPELPVAHVESGSQALPWWEYGAAAAPEMPTKRIAPATPPNARRAWLRRRLVAVDRKRGLPTRTTRSSVRCIRPSLCTVPPKVLVERELLAGGQYGGRVARREGTVMRCRETVI